MNSRAFLLSVGIAGVVMAILSNLPLISICNCLLCMWVWGSSILAVYLYRNFDKTGPMLSVGQGVALGIAAGVVGGIIGAIISAIFAGANTAAMLDFLRSQESLRPYLDTYGGLIQSGGFHLLGSLFSIVIYAIFGAVGGIIATTLIWKAPVPPAISQG